MICYKAVKVVTINRRKYRVSRYTDKQLTYYKGKFTEAPFGGILVFQELSQAKVTASCYTETEIWKAECEDQIKLPQFRTHEFDDIEMLKKVWNEGLTYLKDNTWFWPKGTLAFKRVKLIEKVASSKNEIKWVNSIKKDY